MSYATAQDMLDRFGDTEMISITDRTDASILNVPVLLRALGDSFAEINTYLGRYTLPLPEPQPVLKRIECDIARYRLYDDRSTELIRERYVDAINFLKLVAKGEVQLGVEAADQDTTNDGPSYSSPGRVFTMDTLKVFGS